jgi:hypothetical protein
MSGATRRTLATILDAMLDAFPSHGRDLGLRAYQGRVDDLSPPGCAGGPAFHHAPGPFDPAPPSASATA